MPSWNKTISMPHLKRVHHIAIICGDYEVSKHFYTKVLGLEILREEYRQERASYKLDLSLNGLYTFELFSFPNSPERPSYPEAKGLRHLAFEVDELEQSVDALIQMGIAVESIRIDEFTGKKFTFISDPDGLPIELYEA